MICGMAMVSAPLLEIINLEKIRKLFTQFPCIRLNKIKLAERKEIVI
jgi:hypothetical protein